MTETTYKEGIYFNMPFDEYREIKAANRSYLEKLPEDIEEAWKVSPFNPEREESEDTPQMKLGRAVHSAVLEPEIFQDLYVRTPRPEDFAGQTILDKNTELSEFLASVGEKKSGKKEELIARALPHLNPKTHVIWDNVMSSFYSDVDAHGKTVLTDNDSEIVRGILQKLKESDEIEQIFTKGYPEVTLIWKDGETLCKARLDYVRPEAIGELKTFSYRGKKNMFKAMADEINYNKYNAQFVFYYNALKLLIKKVKSNKAEVFGDVDKAWLEKFLENPNKHYFIVFTRTESPYQMKAIELKQAAIQGASDNQYYVEGLHSVKQGLALHKSFTNKAKEFESVSPNLVWRDPRQVEVLQDEHIPNVMYQNFSI